MRNEAKERPGACYFTVVAVQFSCYTSMGALIFILFLTATRYRDVPSRIWFTSAAYMKTIGIATIVGALGLLTLSACSSLEEINTDPLWKLLAHDWRTDYRIAIFVFQVALGISFKRVIVITSLAFIYTLSCSPWGFRWVPWSITVYEVELLTKGLIAAYQREKLAKITFLWAWVTYKQRHASRAGNLQKSPSRPISPFASLGSTSNPGLGSKPLVPMVGPRGRTTAIKSRSYSTFSLDSTRYAPSAYSSFRI
jgi:hypothetical protein